MTSARKILQSGSALTLYAVADEGGVCEAEAWLEGLPVRPRAQFQARFERLTAIGWLNGEEQMRQLECTGDPVHEIKVPHGPGYRLYVMRQGSDWVATHGGKKRNKKQVCGEATRARDTFASYEERSK